MSVPSCFYGRAGGKPQVRMGEEGNHNLGMEAAQLLPKQLRGWRTGELRKDDATQAIDKGAAGGGKNFDGT